MHNGHDHHHDHSGGGHSHSHSHSHGHGHNQPAAKSVQWQTPHLPHGHAHPDVDPRKTDLDLVEAAFVEAFMHASDVTSFLRVAGVPFVGEDGSGKRLHLLRVETEDLVDVGAVAPLLGGAGVRYDPLPAKMTSRRRRLAFLFHDGQAIQRLDLASAKSLADRSEASFFETSKS
ncbi:hypothetical protein [Chenggangzhangella methanolivorans]|uniref:Uncharacterized protein n=1 Tax=Chenggangzhangella methanolivorans TaxID=1437009 RepID=A0A9E6R9G0_9HYPH|nr:hypothetical protein [Chenggangzhangella methanolivorans]QZO00235.1 hypothetical protein K6K41_27675 [Chenggangzhangella methanolivorans]